MSSRATGSMRYHAARSHRIDHRFDSESTIYGCGMLRLFSLLVWVTLLAACSAPEERASDPLEERIFRSRDLGELSRKELLAKLDIAGVIYLGEKHDNPRQHALQLDIVRALIARGHRPAIGFEVFSVAETSLLMSYATAKVPKTHQGKMPPPEERLRRALGWGKQRDQSWAFYGPLVQIAREHRLVIVGIDLPRSLRRRIARVGIGGLTKVERRLLDPTAPRSDAYADLMRARLKAMHCGHGSDAYIDRLYQNWVARNDTMAAAISDMVAQQNGEPVVVILGAGHTQHNLGAYARVAELVPGIAQLNLAFREVAETPLAVDELLHAHEFEGTRYAPDHEYVWFTARAGEPAPDPCERFGKKPEKTS
jgi:uncharacterized iron-regulated protein